MPSVICAAGEHPIERESPARGVCTRCFDRLPKVTRDLYARGELNIRRVVELARLRSTSYSVLRPHRISLRK